MGELGTFGLSRNRWLPTYTSELPILPDIHLLQERHKIHQKSTKRLFGVKSALLLIKALTVNDIPPINIDLIRVGCSGQNIAANNAKRMDVC